MPFWSVAQTESRREHVAADYLKREDFKIYCPKILIENPTGRDRVAPLFPGYLFVEIIDCWWPVRWTVGVVRLLMVNEHPAVVPQKLLDAIRNSEGVDGLVRLASEVKPAPRTLRCGDTVKVVRGSFEHRIGVYQGQSGSQRSRILLNLLGREVRAIVRTADVASVG